MKNRENGLIIDRYNTKIYYKDGLFHREDGPAIEHANGHKAWYINGMRHREDGPAIIFSNGLERYYFYDQMLPNIKSQKEYEKYIKLLPFQ
jgi:hypothetical protein